MTARRRDSQSTSNPTNGIVERFSHFVAVSRACRAPIHSAVGPTRFRDSHEFHSSYSLQNAREPPLIERDWILRVELFAWRLVNSSPVPVRLVETPVLSRVLVNTNTFSHIVDIYWCMAQMNFDKDDVTAAIPGAHVLFVLISMGAASFSLLGFAVGGGIEALSGMPIATVGVFGTFAAGWFFRRTRKRLDQWDKVGLGVSGGVPLILVIATPVSDFVYSDPVIGLAASIPVVAGYVVSVER